VWRFGNEKVPTEDVFHVRYQSMPGHMLGLNPIQVMRYSFGLAHGLDIHAEQFFANSAAPPGVIQTKRELNLESADKMKASWNSKFQGLHRTGEVAILDNESEFKPIAINAQDQQLLESRKYSAEEISGVVFRIPPHMVGLNERSTSFGRGIEQQERGFVANTLAGYLCRGERAMTALLPKGNYANFDISHRIRGSELERAQIGSLGTLGGFFLPDDVRGKFFDMPPLPNGEGDHLSVPQNTELLEAALESIAKMEKEKNEPEQQLVMPGMPAPKALTNGKGPAKNVPVPTK
jgi:HK97 family phage portal protein